MKRIVLRVFMMGLVLAVQAAQVGEPVEYRAGDTVMTGYLAYDDAIKGKRPG
jgi:hypothetical protein